ncbi:MAG TPA: GNAT family N-acetyltransferase, partial [Gammaproteobacteria bacterium]|nr:GNAT family N-acetyltransferase [Gammaproteobacteria bacterium]
MNNTLAIKIRLLRKEDDRSYFNSGNIDLDRFFQRFAGQNQFKHYIGSTYIAILETTIVGYITVSPNEITAEKIHLATKKQLPEYPIPVLRIARLAVASKFQGHGIGKQLLKSMLELALRLRDEAGCVGVVVDAKSESISFYRKLG